MRRVGHVAVGAGVAVLVVIGAVYSAQAFYTNHGAKAATWAPAAALRKAAPAGTAPVLTAGRNSTKQPVEPEYEDDLKDFDLKDPKKAELFRVRSRMNAAGQKWVRRLRVPDADVVNVCPRLVVSLSTIPPRISQLEGVIEALKRQHYSPDAIYLGIPPYSLRLGEKYELPDWITNDTTLTIVRLPVDYGPVSKLAAGVIAEKDPNACIITFDDDSAPDEDHIEKAVSWASRFPTAAVAFGGWNMTCLLDETAPPCDGAPSYLFVRTHRDFMCQPESMKLYGMHHCFSVVAARVRGADVVMGVSGPIYRRSMFGDDFLDVPRLLVAEKFKELALRMQGEAAASEEGKKALLQLGPVPDDVALIANDRLKRSPPPLAAFLVDDVIISAYLAHKGTPAIVVPVDVPMSKLPVFNRTRRDFERFPAPHMHHPVSPDAIAALHGESLFETANAVAARYFHHLGWW